jgi:hypothetical protein
MGKDTKRKDSGDKERGITIISQTQSGGGENNTFKPTNYIPNNGGHGSYVMGIDPYDEESKPITNGKTNSTRTDK